MSPAKIGERVGAILRADSHSVKFLGYGVYEGNHTPAKGPFGMTQAEFKKTVGHPYTNPRIRLDNGKRVWGFQCHWGPEREIKHTLVGKKVEHVTLEEEKT